jgi:hypothetical protein
MPTAHYIGLLKNFAASVSHLVLREMFKVNLSLMKHLKSSQFVCLFF